MICFRDNLKKIADGLVHMSVRASGFPFELIAPALFLAEHSHLNAYGRPVFGAVWRRDGNMFTPVAVEGLIADGTQGLRVVTDGGRKVLVAPADGDLRRFSQTDIAHLHGACSRVLAAHSRPRVLAELALLPAWNTPLPDGSLDWLLMVAGNRHERALREHLLMAQHAVF